MFENCVFGVYKELEAERLELIEELQRKLASEETLVVPGVRASTAELASTAESAFVDYRQNTCDSVYQQFMDGSARGAFAQACNIKLTRDHNSVLRQRLFGQGFGS